MICRKEVIYLSEPKVADGSLINEMHYKESLIDGAYISHLIALTEDRSVKGEDKAKICGKEMGTNKKFVRLCSVC